MSNLYFSGEYKDKIIKLLINNPIVIKLIDPKPDEKNKGVDLDDIDILMGGNWKINGKEITEQGYIFDYNFVNDLTQQTKTFIFVETDIDSITDMYFTEFRLYICIFSHKDLIRLTSNTTPTKNEMRKLGYSGNRIDCLCDAVDRMINGNTSFGIGDVVPANRGHMSIYHPSNNYYGKMLKYTVKNYNPGGDDCDNN